MVPVVVVDDADATKSKFLRKRKIYWSPTSCARSNYLVPVFVDDADADADADNAAAAAVDADDADADGAAAAGGVRTCRVAAAVTFVLPLETASKHKKTNVAILETWDNFFEINSLQRIHWRRCRWCEEESATRADR